MEIVILCFAFISTLFLGLITYRNNPKSATNCLLALLSLDVAIWMVANYLSLIGQNADFTLFWIRIVMLVTTPLGPLIYLFLRCFPSLKADINQGNISLIIIVGFIVSLISISPFTFSDVSLINGVHPQIGAGILAYGTYTLFFLVAGITNIYKKYKTSTGVVKLQMKYLILGFFLTFFSMFVTNFVFVVFFNVSEMVVYGPVFILVLLGFITYSIFKHRLLDIRFVLARTVSYSLLSLIIVTFYISAIYLIGSYLIPGSFGKSQIFISVMLSLFVAYSLQPLKKFLEKTTDKYFFQDLYDPEELYKDVSHILASNIEMEILVKKVFHKISTTLRIEHISIINRDIHLIPQHQLLVVFDDLPENELKQYLRKISASVLVKLETKEKYIGLLVLGNKLSGDAYNGNDLEVLEVIGPQLAVAIQNSQHYEEIKSFSVKLKLEVKKATSELKQANSKLQELDVLKDEFVSVASHELRTPMTAIKSYLWMALSGQGGKLNEKQKFYLQRSYDSTDRLIKLVNDMLNISRIESGRMSLEFSKTNLGQLIKDTIAEISPRAQEQCIKLDLKIPAHLPPVIADADKIKEVVINLVGNSLKFTPKSGTVTIELGKVGDFIVSKITDTGSGMTEEMIRSLFQKFGLIKGSYQTNQTSPAQGAGLGLYICKQIINLHQGEIHAESAGIRQGSTFSFTLPISTPKRLSEFQKKLQRTSDVGIIHNKI